MELQNRGRAVIQAAFRKQLEQGRLSRSNPRITSRNNKRLPLRREADVTNKSLIENSVNSLAIEMAALRQSLQLRALGLSECHVCKYATDQYHPR